MFRLFSVIAIVLAGCQPAAGTLVEPVRLSDGTEIVLDVQDVTDRAERENGVRLRLASGVTVTVQEIPREARLARGERNVASVAEALATRIELGERTGALTVRQCRVDDEPARCVDGWMEREGQRFARHGAVFEAGERIVWLDVSGPAERSAVVEEHARRLITTARVHRSEGTR